MTAVLTRPRPGPAAPAQPEPGRGVPSGRPPAVVSVDHPVIRTIPQKTRTRATVPGHTLARGALRGVSGAARGGATAAVLGGATVAAFGGATAGAVKGVGAVAFRSVLGSPRDRAAAATQIWDTLSAPRALDAAPARPVILDAPPPAALEAPSAPKALEAAPAPVALEATLLAGETAPTPGLLTRPLPGSGRLPIRPMPGLAATLQRPSPRPVAQPAPQPEPDPRQPWWRSTSAWRVFLFVAALAGFALRFWRSDVTMDLFVDEPFYAQVGQSIARGSMPYATGSPFFLHPPGVFYLEALWMRIFGIHDNVFAQVFSLRKLVAVLAGVTALMIGVLMRRTAGRLAAAVAVVIYLVNAFANRESLVMLEPLTLLLTISGYAVFAHLQPRGGDWRRRQIIAGGLLFGLANLSKEFAVFVTLLPLVVAFVLRCWITRREVLLAAVMACVPWAVWLVVIAVTGYWQQFYVQVTAGFHRTTGNTQISGFNRKGAPSFLDTIIANLASMWTAYAILGLGSLAIVWIAWKIKDDQRLRFVSLFGVGAIPLLAYCVLLGTNEEQFFNFLFFPGLICLVALARVRWSRWSRPVRVTLLALLAAGLLGDAATYVSLHSQTDDGTYLIDRWMAQHVPAGTPIGTTNPVQRQIFLRYDMIDDQPGTDLDPDVRYLIVFDKQVDQGYAFVDRETVDRQVRGQRIAYETTHRSNGRMIIYAIR